MCCPHTVAGLHIHTAYIHTLVSGQQASSAAGGLDAFCGLVIRSYREIGGIGPLYGYTDECNRGQTPETVAGISTNLALQISAQFSIHRGFQVLEDAEDAIGKEEGKVTCRKKMEKADDLDMLDENVLPKSGYPTIPMGQSSTAQYRNPKTGMWAGGKLSSRNG